MLTTTIANPYIGPRPFEQKDQKLFFGRDFESDEIVSLIFSHQLLLVYAQSGTGKTSIFNGQIIPELENNGFDVLPTARIRLTSELAANHSDSKKDIKSSDIANIYVFNTLQSLDPIANSESMLNKTLSQFLKEHFPAKTDDRGNPKPQILIFDQFEELFNLFVDDSWHENQRSFFRQITDALDSNSSLRCVFVIREDYVARLDPFKEILPEKLRARFRLERLSQAAALAAIKGPLKVSGVLSDEFDDEIKKIIDDLLKIRVESFGKGTRKTLEINGNFVEPIQLQVVCQKWWTERVSANSVSGGSKISPEYTTNVDEALEDFYDTAIRAAANSSAAKRAKVNESNIREWCEKKLITPSETRGIVYQGDKFTDGLPNDIVEILDKKYLIRPELRSGAAWYELTHDRLIRPVKESNLKRNEEERLKKSKRIRLIAIPSIAIGGIVLAILITQFILPVLIPEPEQELGDTPSYVGINNETNRIYVSNAGNGSVSVIDGTNDRVIENIPIPGLQNPLFLAIDPAPNRIYVSGLNNNTVSIIDGKNNEVIKDQIIKLENFQLPQIPSGLYLNPQTNTTYVTKVGSNNISLIDGSTNRLLPESILLDQEDPNLIINDKTNMIYAIESDSESPTISVINGTTNQVVNESIPVPYQQDPTEISINPETNMIYVLGTNITDPDYENIISVINGTTNQVVNESIPVPDQQDPTEISINPETNMIYLAGYNTSDDSESESSIISVINGTTNQVVNESIPVPQDTSEISINPETNMIYLAGYNTSDDSESSIISVINGTTNQVVNESITVLVPQDPTEKDSGISINPETNMIYFIGTNTSSKYVDSPQIYVINGTTNEVLNQNIELPYLSVRQSASNLAVNPDTNTVYVLGYNNTRSRHVEDTETEDTSELAPISVLNAIDTETNRIEKSTLLDTNGFSHFSVDRDENVIYSTDSQFLNVIDGDSQEVIKRVPLKESVQYVTHNPITNMIYAAGSDSESPTISVINGTTKEEVDVITLDVSDDSIADIMVNPNSNMIYAAGSESISVIDGDTNSIVGEFSIGTAKNILDLSVNPKTNTMYVSDFESNTVYAVDPDNKITSTVQGPNPLSSKVGEEPADIFLNLNTNMIYTAGSESISVIDGRTNKLLNHISIERVNDGEGRSNNRETPKDRETPEAIVFNEKTNMIYVPTLKNISVINGAENNKVNDTFAVEGIEEVEDMIIDQEANMIYVLGANSISIINGTDNQGIDNFELLTERIGVTSFNPETKMIYAEASNGTSSDFVLAIDPNKQHTTTIPISQELSYLTINGKSNLVYAANPYSIFVIDGKTNKLVRTIPLDEEPSYISVNERTNTIYVIAGGLNDEALYAIDGPTNKVVARINMTQTISDISIIENKNMIYVLGYNSVSEPGIGSDSISVIDGKTNHIIQNIPLPHIKGANAMTINPETGMLYVLSKSSESVSVINTTTNEILRNDV